LLARPLVRPALALAACVGLFASSGLGTASDKAGARRREPTHQAGFVAKKPGPETQVQKTVQERGVNPCDTPDPGFGPYREWDRGITLGQFIMPKQGAVNRKGEFDVMFHFHGHEAVRKEWVQAMDGAVLVGIDLGLGSGSYETTFQAPDVFPRLVDSVERAIAKKSGRASAHARTIGLSAWSAGYGAAQYILAQDFGKRRIDTLILLDGLHCGYYGQSLNEPQIGPFIQFAREAAAGNKFMFVSHSSIIPPDYASTTETADFLIYKLGGEPHPTHGTGPLGLELISRYSKGNFHVRGFAGNDKMDHCAQIGMYRDVLKVHVRPRWKTLRGSKD
jgi:hypothetical protein